MVRVYREGRSISEQAANIETNGYKYSFPVAYTECMLDVYSDACAWAFKYPAAFGFVFVVYMFGLTVHEFCTSRRQVRSGFDVTHRFALYSHNYS